MMIFTIRLRNCFPNNDNKLSHYFLKTVERTVDNATSNHLSFVLAEATVDVNEAVSSIYEPHLLLNPYLLQQENRARDSIFSYVEYIMSLAKRR